MTMTQTRVIVIEIFDSDQILVFEDNFNCLDDMKEKNQKW